MVKRVRFVRVWIILSYVRRSDRLVGVYIRKYVFVCISTYVYICGLVQTYMCMYMYAFFYGGLDYSFERSPFRPPCMYIDIHEYRYL
jgi:hypothetical protein